MSCTTSTISSSLPASPPPPSKIKRACRRHALHPCPAHSAPHPLLMEVPVLKGEEVITMVMDAGRVERGWGSQMNPKEVFSGL